MFYIQQVIETLNNFVFFFNMKCPKCLDLESSKISWISLKSAGQKSGLCLPSKRPNRFLGICPPANSCIKYCNLSPYSEGEDLTIKKKICHPKVSSIS